MSISSGRFNNHEWHIGSSFTDERGLHIRIDAEKPLDIKDVAALGNAVLRPVDSNGALTESGAYLWLTIPLAKNRPGVEFGNQGKR